jgi:hypothetical protein
MGTSTKSLYETDFAEWSARTADLLRRGRLARREREALTLETVKLAVGLECDLNTTNTDGRTALDGAKALNYDSVVSFLVEKGAKPGTGNGLGRGRGGRVGAGR